MPSRPKIVVNVSAPGLDGIMTAFNSSATATLRTFAQSDGGLFDYLFVEETGNEVGDIHRALDLTGYLIETALGSLNTAPTGGAYSLGYDGDYGGLNDIAFNASQAAMQAAFDANTTVGAGGVVVTKYGSNAYQIRFTTVGVRELIEVVDGSNNLTPITGVYVTRTQTGDGSTVDIQWIRLVESPIAYTSSFTPSTSGQVNVTRLQTGTPLLKEVQRISLSVPATSGAFVANVTTKQEIEVQTVADVAGSLDETGFIAEDGPGTTVGIWLDHGGGGTAPAEILACTRQLAITTTANDMSAANIAIQLKLGVDADAQFVATVAGNVVTIRQAAGGLRVDATDVGTGFTFTTTASGIQASGSVPVDASASIVGALCGDGFSVTKSGTSQWDITFPTAGTQDLITVEAEPLFQIIYTADLNLATNAAFQKYYTTGGSTPLDLYWEISIKPPGEGPITVYHQVHKAIFDLITDGVSAGIPLPSGLTTSTGVNYLNGVTGYTGGGPTKLDGITTTTITVPYLAIFVHATEGGRMYVLVAGTDAESSPGIIRPDDYNAVTNAKVWKSVL